MSNFFESIFNNLNLFDICVAIILIYFVIQCYLKGFSLSLISFMKWVISTVITIILVPKLQPTVSDYIESGFINNFGLGLAIFVFTLFLTIVIGKTLGKEPKRVVLRRLPKSGSETNLQSFKKIRTLAAERHWWR